MEIVKCVIDKQYIKIPLKLIKEKELFINKIKKDLTFKINTNPKYNNFIKSKEEKKIKIYHYQKDNEILFIPKFSKISNVQLKFIKDIRDLNNEKILLKFTGLLNNQQLEVIKNTEEKLLTEYNILYSLPCGFGKTVLAIYWICKLGIQTFILVHKYDLLKQWIQRLKDFTDIEEEDICIISSSSKYDKTKKYKIYIGMIQTIMRDDFDDSKIPQTSGLLISDECHHLGAECFNKGLRKLFSKYYISLSATPFRNDGTEKVYKSYIGYNLYKQERNFNDPIKVVICKYSASDEFKKKNEKILNSIYCSKITTIISENEERNKKILDLIYSLISKNKKILILSDRINQLEIFYNSLKDKINVNRSFGKYRENINNCDILLATYSMASEGLDVRQMDTLIMATPRSNITQSCGRIMREENNRERLIYDILDFEIYENGFYQRKKYYKQITNTIEEINF